MSIDIIPAPNGVSAHQRRKAAHTMGVCGHGIMSVDIIPAPNGVSAHQRRKAAHTMGACGHGIIKIKLMLTAGNFTGRRRVGMNLDICIDMVYNKENFTQSMDKIRRAGITAYEFWSWWDKDVELILEKQKELDMKCIAFCTRFITLLDPLHRQAYIDGLRESIAMAKRFGTKLLISQTGGVISGKSYEEQWESLVSGLKECAPVLEENDIILVVEPLNLTDHPGYYLTKSGDAFRLMKEVGSSHIKILYDIYHFQITEGDLIRTISENINDIGHFHCAGNPGRGNITEGEINYPEVFRAINRLGYQGHIGFEGRISGDREEGIKRAETLFNLSGKSPA